VGLYNQIQIALLVCVALILKSSGIEQRYLDKTQHDLGVEK